MSEIKELLDLITTFFRKKKIKKQINNSTNKNEKILEQINDQMDYDGMGNYGRFPPLKEKQ